MSRTERIEPYSVVPDRFYLAHSRGEITATKLSLVQHLIYRCRRDEGSTAVHLREFKTSIEYHASSEQLRVELLELHEAGDFDVTSPGQGSRKPWIVRAKAAIPAHFQQTTADVLEVTSNGDGSTEAAKRDQDTASGVFRPPTVRLPDVQQSRAELSSTERQSAKGDFGGDHVARFVADLRHADRNTERIYRRDFGRLPEDAWARTAERLNEQRASKNPPENDAAWCSKLLKTYRDDVAA